MKEKLAAVYLRSSKDRSDVSIDAQRRQLQELALTRGLTIINEFADAVESGKDEYRPGFVALNKALRSPERRWTKLLLLDTSRLARRTYIASVFENEADKAGVEVVYKTIPDQDPITASVIRNVFRAIDEYHSLISKQKALSGMAENINQGWRSGGRAPTGYRLKVHKTGAIRDGEPVTKTTLEKDPIEAKKVQQYLKLRISGSNRPSAIAQTGLKTSKAGLVDLEYNALVYAGCTVWNRCAERLSEGGYKGGNKYRPQSEWIIKEDTHEPLISRQEADLLLHNLAQRKREGTRDRNAGWLLSGLLIRDDGVKYTSDVDNRIGKRYYRPVKPAKGKRIPADEIEQVILAKLFADMKDPAFIQGIIASIKKRKIPNINPEIVVLKKAIDKITTDIDKALAMALELEDSAPALRFVERLEKQRLEKSAQLAELEQELEESAVMSSITEAQIEDVLDHLSRDMQEKSADELHCVLMSMLTHIKIKPDSHAVELHYRIKPASPGERRLKPGWFIPHISITTV